ncbi:MAG: CHAT domain-containing protein [Rhodocyclales bacterium]|nr:CHAT domain-containing protein [Rhodocyclales bacterium]
MNLSDIQQKLSAAQSIVSYYYDADDLYAFVIDEKSLNAARLERNGLEDDIQSFRQAIANQDEGYRQSGQMLYNRLIAPLAGQLHHPKLLVAAHGALHYLPFAALTDGQNFLLDRYEISVLPSASTLMYVGNIKVADKPGTVLAFGNPDLGDKQYNLAFAEMEAKGVAGLFEKSAMFLGKEASKSNFKEYAQGFKYLHFATHGTFDSAHPLDSALMLSTTSVEDTRDRLTIGELYSMHIDADLVTLSACKTGLGKVANGDDVVGLVRGFMYAGTNQIVSTLWEIDDAATESLMTDFYQRIKAGESKTTALRESQRDIRKQYPNPFFWAAFQITGRREDMGQAEMHRSRKEVVGLRQQ